MLRQRNSQQNAAGGFLGLLTYRIIGTRTDFVEACQSAMYQRTRALS